MSDSPLPTRRLGDSGPAVPVVGLGCNNFGRRTDVAGTRAVVDAAIDDGVTFLDTADIYGPTGLSEEYLGEVLSSGSRRDRVVLATKFGMDMHDGKGPRGSRAYVMDAVQASLRRLQTDVIDYYWYHQPDGVTPVEETLGALHELVTAGTVRAIGASNFSGAQLREAAEVAARDGLTPFTAVQNHYSLLERGDDDDALPACRELGLGYVPFFPLASGLLTGKYRRGEPAPDGARLSDQEQIATPAQFDLIEALGSYAAARGVSLLDVAIGGLLADETISTVIAGATRPEQVHSNAAAARWIPAGDDLDALRQVLAEHPL
jgi:aryl-alcohol dehydrogenase-like predicted oxidoreductase